MVYASKAEVFIHKYLLVKHANVQTSNRMSFFSKQEYSLTSVIFYVSCSDEFFLHMDAKVRKPGLGANSRNLIKPFERKSMKNDIFN